MSLAVMLSTSIATSQTTIQKLSANGSNWIFWKTHIQILIRVKKLAHLLDKNVTCLTKLEPLTGTPSAAETTTYKAALEKFQEFDQSDAKVTHGSVKKMPTELVKTLSQNASIVGRYIGEHRVFTPTILVIL